MKKKLRHLVPKVRRRSRQAQQQQIPADKPVEGVPRITNDTVAAHREEVLSSARKYIYPLQHSKHRIVVVTTTLIVTAAVIFVSYCVIALYRLQSTSAFMYRVTQVVPWPVARAGSSFVSYESYLFELRHYMHFYQNQQKLDFKSDAGKQQLKQYRMQARDKVIGDAYVKQLARKSKVSVSSQEIEDQITILRRQNRLGGSEQALEDALRQNFGWSLEDFKRVIRQRLLEQKVVSAMDISTRHRADVALAELGDGASFGSLAAKYSDDALTKTTNGEFGPTDKSNPDIMPQTLDTLFSLQPGQVSAIINTGYSLEIIKNIEVTGDKIKGAHIVFNFQDIDKYVNDLKEKHRPQVFINP